MREFWERVVDELGIGRRRYFMMSVMRPQKVVEEKEKTFFFWRALVAGLTFFFVLVSWLLLTGSISFDGVAFVVAVLGFLNHLRRPVGGSGIDVDTHRNRNNCGRYYLSRVRSGVDVSVLPQPTPWNAIRNGANDRTGGSAFVCW